ncbi:KilA-N domain-containing protein [Pseudotabrizicola sp. 4114]|uniref:KilA-N domain-containing protein n=1 Tax=Pseudotabrizicola sp. 4114 TaxID=2817731 RepID=UPI0028571902|nr:hypothetical protein [Pseudorhodobacter sp. 4114]
MTENTTAMVIRGRKIATDINGLVSLTDIHSASGFSKNRTPGDWLGLQTTTQRILRVLKLNTGKSGNWTKTDYRTATYAKRGAGGGTFADPRLALDYAEYLNPALAIEVKEVFLRYKSADPTLADEVLQRATDEQNEWAATRALGRVKRNEFTEALKQHNVSGFGYGNCTNAVYKEVLGGTSKAVLKARDLPEKTNLRDKMSKDELVYVMMAETLARQRIEDEKPTGNTPCERATQRSASFVRQAIDLDRKDRQKSLGM